MSLSEKRRTAIYKCPGCNATMQFTERFAKQWAEIATEVGPYSHGSKQLCLKGIYYLDVAGFHSDSLPKSSVNDAAGLT